jgi:hypothetical protein
MKTIFFLILATAILVVSSCSKEETADPQTAPSTNTVTTSTITYSNTISSIISSNCTVSCHKSGHQGFSVANLTTYAGVKTEVDAGTLRNRVVTQKNMPPSGPLSEATIQKIKEWLDNSAPQ